jgi:hypothetical protein
MLSFFLLKASHLLTPRVRIHLTRPLESSIFWRSTTVFIYGGVAFGGIPNGEGACLSSVRVLWVIIRASASGFEVQAEERELQTADGMSRATSVSWGSSFFSCSLQPA